MRNFFMLTITLILGVTGCKKEGDPTPIPVVTKTDLLTKNNGWTITAATVSPGIVIGAASYTDFYSLLEACQKDDKLVFNAAGTYKEDNPLKCDSSELSVNESGTWAFNTTETIISFSPSGGDRYEYSILDLNAFTLKVSYQFTLGTSSQIYTLTAVYKPL